MPRIEITTRRMMALVAAVAMLLGIWSWMRSRSKYFHNLEYKYLERASKLDAFGANYRVPGDEKCIYYMFLADKYRDASERPWLPVPPDPPEPE